MACESGLVVPKLKSCFEQINQILAEGEKGYQEKIVKLEDEKKVLYGLLENRKDLEKENAEVKAEKKVLQDQVINLRLSLNETESQFRELEKRFETLKKDCSKKQNSLNRFLHTVQRKCTCKFKESLSKSEIPIFSPSLKVQTVSNVFFKSPVKAKFNQSVCTALVPMTEDINFDTPTGALKASTPLVVGETEKSPFIFYEIDSSETDSDDEWLNSPSLFTNDESKETFEMPNQNHDKTVPVDKKHFPNPVEGLLSAEWKAKNAEVSAELFSDDSTSKKNEFVKETLSKQNKEERHDNHPITSNLNLDICKQFDEHSNRKKREDVGKLNGNDSFFEFSESIQKKSKIMKVMSQPIVNPSKNPSVNVGESIDIVATKAVKKDENIGNNKNADVKYKYSSVVRKKEEREKLNGYACEECRRYYQSDNLTEEQLKEVLKHCSRHKHECSPPPSTPDDFWKLDFPPTQDCIDRGYMLDENQTLPDYVKPKWRKSKRKKNV